MGKTRKYPNNITIDRIRTLREKHGDTQAHLAEIVGVAPLTIHRYEKGESAWTDKAILALSKHYRVPPAYLYGETDCSTWSQYSEELEALDSAVCAEHWREEQNRAQQIESFFSLCGYEYKNTDDHPGYVSQIFGLQLDGYAGPTVDRHQVTSPDLPNPQTYFSDDELDNLLEKIHDLVAFECWKKQQARGKDDK